MLCSDGGGSEIRGSQERRTEKMEEKVGLGVGWHEMKTGEARIVCGGRMEDAGNGGRVSEWWWVMKYSVRVCLWLLPSFFFFSFDISG